MKKGFAVLSLFLSAVAWLSVVTDFTMAEDGKSSAVVLTTERWRRDLRHLAKELTRLHPNAFHTVTRGAFEKAVDELDAELPALSEPEIVVRLQRIAAMIGDGHTSLSPFPPDTFRRYPLRLFWFGKDLRVVGVASVHGRALGARVVQVGELDVTEAHARIARLIPRENDYWERFVSANYFPFSELLVALNILPRTEGGTWTFEDENGKRFSLEMKTVSPEDKIDWASASKDFPLYRQRPGERFWFTAADSKTLYVNLRGYPDLDEFKKTSDELLRVVETSRPQRLVLDVRHNVGGDCKKGRYLLAGLKNSGAFANPGSVHVVIGRATASAAMVNAIDFKRELNAVLVGEPTGGKPNNYSENEFFSLPNSRLRVSHSTKYLKFLDSDTPALMPDKLIEPSWDALRSGKDPVMDWILAQPFNR